MSEPTKYPQVPYLVTTTRVLRSDGRVSWYHTLSDGRIIGYWERRNVDTGAPVPSEWVEVAPPLPDALLDPVGPTSGYETSARAAFDRVMAREGGK